MDKAFCRKIDEEFLIEQYVKGGLPEEMRRQVEQHIQTCPVHAQALRLEKLLHHGIKEYARNEMKQRLQSSLRKTDETKMLILRFAAILFIGVFIPVMLYYGLYLNKPVSEEPEELKTLPPAPAIVAEQPADRSEMKQLRDQTRARPAIRKTNLKPLLQEDLLIIDPDSGQASISIRNRIAENQTELKQCAAEYTKNVQAFAVEFSLNTDGKIEHMTFSDELNANPAARTCLENILYGIAFGRPGRAVQIYYRFNLDSVKIPPAPKAIDQP